MKCLLTDKQGPETKTAIHKLPRPRCNPGQVLIKTKYSSINYKDALAVTGKGAILRSFPLVAGIDCGGHIEESQSENFQPGQEVLVTGCGLGETHNGGYAEYVLEAAENVIAIPKGLDARKAMILGTAGFTAALAIERLLQNGQTPQLGKVIVTGASGGVGQFAVRLLHLHDFGVIAVSAKAELHSRLKDLGASEVLHPDDLPKSRGPLGSVHWGGGIDNVGGDELANLLAHCQLWGSIASIGLASSPKLNSTVMPFILRGVSLLGVSSNNTPRLLREKIWQNLAARAESLDLESFVAAELPLEEVVEYSEKILARKTHGRALVSIGSDQ